MNSSPYKRRRPSLLKNFWVYRRLILAALVMGLLLWFVASNSEKVTIVFPFGLGTYPSTTGWVILLSALVGAAVTILIHTIVWAVRFTRSGRSEPEPVKSRIDLDDLPPSDYAAKTGEGVADPWKT